MKWTTAQPTEPGFYWMTVRPTPQTGPTKISPMRLELDDTGDLIMTSIGAEESDSFEELISVMRSICKAKGVEIEILWSDVPIPEPDGVE